MAFLRLRFSARLLALEVFAALLSVVVEHDNHGERRVIFEAEGAKTFSARRSDIPFIKCQVCEEIVKEVAKRVKSARVEVAPKKLSELKIIGITEKICSVKLEEGDWIQWMDLVEKGSALKMVKQSRVGECRSECKTIQRACEEILESYDTDVAEFLFDEANKPSALSEKLCRSWTSSCSKTPPPLPKDRKPGEKFLPKSDLEVERESMVRNMEAKQELFQEENPNAPRMPKMKLYSRDDLMKNPKLMGTDSDDDEDEEEEEEEEEDGKGKKGSSKEDELREVIAKAIEKAKTAKAEMVKEEALRITSMASSLFKDIQTFALKGVGTIAGGIRKFIHKGSNWLGRGQDGRGQDEL